MKAIKLTLLIIAIVFLLCACSSDVSLKTLEYKGYITIGYIQGSYYNEIIFKIINEIVKDLELEVVTYKTDELSWQADLHNGKIDMMIDMYNDIDIKSDVIISPRVLLIKHDEVLDTGKIGVIDAGDVRDAALIVRDFNNCKYIYYGQDILLINDFMQGIIDGMIISEYKYKLLTKVQDKPYDVINQRDIYLTFRAEDIKVIEAINKGLAILNSKEKIDEIIYDSE